MSGMCADETDNQQASDDAVSEAIEQNLEKVARFAHQEDAKRSSLQRVIERLSVVAGNPPFLIGFVVACAAWLISDLAWHRLGHPYFDPWPFSLLQGVITFIGVLITMAVLIRQNRLARVEDQRAHLELQINILAEQKATKIIVLLEELRRDMPGVRDRHDEHAETLQAVTNPEAVLDAIRNLDSSDSAPDGTTP